MEIKKLKRLVIDRRNEEYEVIEIDDFQLYHFHMGFIVWEAKYGN